METAIAKLQQENRFNRILLRKQQERIRELEKKLLYDAMTCLYSKNAGCEFLEKKIKECGRSKKSITVIMCDIDHFKKINDTYGHQTGDLVIKKVASTLKKHVRENDIIFRYGGEEFTIIMSDTKPKNAKAIIERLREKVEGISDINIKVTMSFGIYTSNATENMHVLIEKADQALYKAKNKGRNRVVIYTN